MSFEIITNTSEKFVLDLKSVLKKLESEKKYVTHADVAIGVYSDSKTIISMTMVCDERGCSVGLDVMKGTLMGMSQYVKESSGRYKLQNLIHNSEALSRISKVTIGVNPV